MIQLNVLSGLNLAGRQNTFGIDGLVLLSETHLRASGSSGWDRRTTVCSTTGTRTPVP